MDVLAYSAFNQRIAYNQEIVDKTSILDTKCSETAAKLATAAGLSDQAICWIRCIEPCLQSRPFDGYTAGYWNCIPTLTGSGFKVCDTTATEQFNCGASSVWTVPDGVTRARFQLWGAGGGANKGPCCCGHSPFGSTGAYASVIISVTPGSEYTICAGCAFCCFGSSTSGSSRVPGCPSWVTGPGLCNFCANGGQGSIANSMATYGGSLSGSCYYGTFNCTGQSICNGGGDTCFISSCSSGGEIPHIPGASYFGTTTSADSPSIVYGLRGMWPAICWTTDNYGYECHAPIYCFDSISQCVGTWTSGNCCACRCRAACGCLRVPSAGGWWGHAMGGGTNLTGDMGRLGMVCVTYC